MGCQKKESRMPQKFGAKDDFGSYRQYQKDKQLLLQRKYYKRNLGEKISLAYEQVNMEVHIRHQVEQAGQFMSLDFRGEN